MNKHFDLITIGGGSGGLAVAEQAAASGKKVAIIGGGQVGSELAWLLAEQAKRVTVVEMTYAIASDVNLFSRFYLLNKLTELGVETAIGTTAEEVTEQGVAVVDISGHRKVIDADTVVLAVGFRSNNELKGKLEGKVPELD